MSVCNICFEQKNEFVFCQESNKHSWCTSCNQSILYTNQHRCPFCRSPFSSQVNHINLNQDPEDNEIMPVPILRRQNAEYF